MHVKFMINMSIETCLKRKPNHRVQKVSITAVY